ncbi:MAG: hypothetical protein ACTSRU_17495 [Candidatus Hodarchaeales archaeon]
MARIEVNNEECTMRCLCCNVDFVEKKSGDNYVVMECPSCGHTISMRMKK